MKKTTLLKTMLLLCALVAGSGSVWGGDVTTMLTGSSMLEGSSPSTSYADHTTGVTDDRGFTYTGRWTYQKNGSDYMNMIQLKKTESSNSSRIQLPTFDGPIKSITITATDASSTTSTGTGASTTLIIVKGTTYSTTFATTAENQVLTAGSKNTATKKFSFDFSTLDDDYDGTGLYICSKDAGIRIWSIAVVYSEVDYYNVIYNYNDGVTANKVVQVAKASAASYSLDAAPTRTDFSFEGWSDGTNTYVGGAAYAITKGVTFTAQWSFTGTTTDYNRSSKSDIATGAKYIMAGVKNDVWGYAADITGSNTFIDAAAFETYSSISATEANLTIETPLLLTLEETSDGWYLKNSEGQKLGLSGDKKVKWDNGDMTWNLGGTDEIPTFAATYNSSDYTIQYNAGSTRFTGYTSGQQDVYFYRLDDGKNVYTLTLDFNDGESADGTHRVLEGASYTLTTPTRIGYRFTGWNTKEDGTGTNYAVGAYTMPAAATTLYAQWSNNTTITLNAACTDGDLVYGTYSNSQAFVVSSDIEVSEVGVVDGKLVIEKYATGDIVPANTGVMIAALEGGNYDVTLSAEAGTSVLGSDNLLKPSGDAGITAANMNVAYTKFYRLTMHNNTQIGFWWGAAEGAAFDLTANKAYLAVPTTSAAPNFFWFGGDVTAIKGIEAAKAVENGAVFNLAGQRVAQPTKGLYIVNGRKVVIK